MVRGTTPEYVLSISGADLTSSDVYVTIAQGSCNITLNGDRLNVSYNDSSSTSTVTFKLTQKETLKFKTGKAQVQARFANDGNVDATNIGEIMVYPVLNEDVI